jgi:hypothetical protein
MISSSAIRPVTPPPSPPEDVSKEPPKLPLKSLLATGGLAVDALQKKKTESAFSSSASQLGQVELDNASKAAAIKAFHIAIRSTSK